MKKAIALLLALVTLLSLTACAGKEDAASSALDQIKQKGELVVGTSADYPPYEFHTEVDGKDTIVGFDMEIAQAIADKLGVSLKIVDMSFDNLLMMLQFSYSCEYYQERMRILPMTSSIWSSPA
jgi:ABC-type amino acid transport substrate-binding protein